MWAFIIMLCTAGATDASQCHTTSVTAPFHSQAECQTVLDKWRELNAALIPPLRGSCVSSGDSSAIPRPPQVIRAPVMRTPGPMDQALIYRVVE